jgi:hypothetical protein
MENWSSAILAVLAALGVAWGMEAARPTPIRIVPATSVSSQPAAPEPVESLTKEEALENLSQLQTGAMDRAFFVGSFGHR